MPYPARDLVLFPVTTVVASTTQANEAEITLPEAFTSAIVTLNVGTVTGTSPTLNCYIQEKLTLPAAADVIQSKPTGSAIYSDVISFTQVTSSNTTVIAQVVGGGNNCAAKSDKALAAGSVRSGPLGRTWVCTLVVAGTNPSFAACNVSARFIP